MSDAHITFGFSEEQRQMRASVLGLLGRMSAPGKIRELDKAGEYPFEAHKALADAGFMGLVYPTEYGGMGGSYMDLAVLGEALGYHYGGIAQAYGITVIYAGMHVALHGSEDMKREVLPKISPARCALPVPERARPRLGRRRHRAGRRARGQRLRPQG